MYGFFDEIDGREKFLKDLVYKFFDETDGREKFLKAWINYKWQKYYKSLWELITWAKDLK